MIAEPFGVGRGQTLASFDWQWAHLASGDFMPGDAWFDANATAVIARELCAIDPAWFRGKRVLDAGCGQGRWTRSLLELGAHVTAVDFSAAGLERTREVCRAHAHLQTRRVDVLAIPDELAAQRFDLVFSFGVLHHTGDTWSALSNIARLVADTGALFLYLYGAASWSDSDRAEVERVRTELSNLPFDAKIEALKRRFPGQDPHQLFDLLSPTINDRVAFPDVQERLQLLGFEEIVQTVASGDLFARATRSGFPRAALLPVAGSESTYARESALRWERRTGAGFELTLREQLSMVPRRATPVSVADAVRRLPVRGDILDVSLPPDRLDEATTPDRAVHHWTDGSPASPGAAIAGRAPVIVALGASAGACRYPSEYLLSLWNGVPRGGALVVELPASASIAPSRSPIDRILDARRHVPGKLAALLRRRPRWCVGEGLDALGGRAFLNPLLPADAVQLLTSAGASSVATVSARPSTVLTIARRA